MVTVLLALLIVGGVVAGVYAVGAVDHSRSCNTYNEIITAAVYYPDNVPNSVWDRLDASDRKWFNSQVDAYNKLAAPTPPETLHDQLANTETAIRNEFLLRHGC